MKLELFSKIKRLMPVIGALIAIASLSFVGHKIANNVHDLAQGKLFTSQVIILIAVLTIVFAIFSNVLGFAWRFLLQAEDVMMSKTLALAIFGKSQIAKYLPGNVFHMVGRQVLAANAGCSHSKLLKSTLWEIFLHAFAAGVLGSILLIYAIPSTLIQFYAVIITIIICFALPSLYRLIEKERVFAFGHYVSFHLMGGLMFAFLVSYFSDHGLAFNQLLIVSGAYCLAWLAGFVVPGAPGGLGVRELVLYTLISPWMDDKVLLNAILVSRVITTLGDVGFFMIGCCLGNLKTEKPSTSYGL